MHTENAEPVDLDEIYTDATLDLLDVMGFERLGDMQELVLEDPLSAENVLNYLRDIENAASYFRKRLLRIQEEYYGGCKDTAYTSKQFGVHNPTNKSTGMIYQDQQTTDSTQQSKY